MKHSTMQMIERIANRSSHWTIDDFQFEARKLLEEVKIEADVVTLLQSVVENIANGIPNPQKYAADTIKLLSALEETRKGRENPKSP